MKGSVRKREKTWEYTVEIGRDPVTNKRKRKIKGGFKTKKACEADMNKLINEVLTGTYFETTSMTMKEYLEYWMETYTRVSVAPSTYTRYKIFCNQINEHFGSAQLHLIKPAHIQGFYSKLITGSKLSNSTILKIHRVLHLALKHAVNWQLLNYNPTDAVTPPRAKTPQMKVWDSETANEFLNEIKDTNMFIPIMIALTTGMRAGEIAALRWDCVDFANRFISVKYNFQRAENNYILAKPKTERSSRTIAMMDRTIHELKKHKKQQIENKLLLGDEYRDEGFVCSWEDGRPFRPNYFSDQFRKFMQDRKSVV